MVKQQTLSQLKRQFKKVFPPRKKNSHKGDFGRVLIVAGSKGMTGAALLSSLAALRSGVGLLSLGTSKSSAQLITSKIPEVMTRPLPENSKGILSAKAGGEIKKMLSNQTAFALGPGLSQDKGVQALIRNLVVSSKIPTILDADGLNAFVDNLQQLKKVKAPLILTPHPGEFKCLFKVKLSSSKTDRIKQAKKIAKQYGAIVVLKGADTVVASGRGDIYINSTGNPGLAKGGSGDVLCGIMAAFLGRGLKPFEAAKWSVFVHGAIADRLVKDLGENSLMPSDILKELPRVLKQLVGC